MVGMDFAQKFAAQRIPAQNPSRWRGILFKKAKVEQRTADKDP
jgi:hypothetical protein